MNTEPNSNEIIASQQAQIARLLDFRNAQGLEIELLKKERDAALAACAEMRDVLAYILSLDTWYGSKDQRAKVKHALSLDCGKDFEHKSKRLEAEAKCARVQKELEHIERISDETSVVHWARQALEILGKAKEEK